MRVDSAEHISEGEFLRLNFSAECKLLCEEPDESFLASIGDPKFNPKRNPDGSIDESAASAAADAGEVFYGKRNNLKPFWQ